jgi:hypothetical protein
MKAPPNEQRRPVRDGAPKSLAGDTPSLRANVDNRREWARHLIAHQTADRPVYGSPAWLALANDHPDKIAACVVAAECWATSGDDLEADLRREIANLRLGYKHGEDEAYQASFRRGSGYTPPSQAKGFAERRAEQIASATPQPGDYMGGPVEWNVGGERI